MNAHPVLFNWQASNAFGWGVIGLAMIQHWPGDVLSGQELGPMHVTDPALQKRVDECMARSRDLWKQWEKGGDVRVPVPVIHAVDNKFQKTPAVHKAVLTGRPDVGWAVFEDSSIPAEAAANLKRFDRVIVSSEWCRERLAAVGVEARHVRQGVDTGLFSVQRRGHKGFVVFSGGKLEYRKGQDIVLRAFKTFAMRHPDAHLLTAWQSPWPFLAQGMKETACGVPPQLANGDIDVKGWARQNGLDPARITDIGFVPQVEMPARLAFADCAVFPCRCEGATNLVAMECLAMGIPTAVSEGTGHLDFAPLGLGLTTVKGGKVGRAPGFRMTDGWVEVAPETLLDYLERQYALGPGRRDIAQAAAMEREYAWRRCIGDLFERVREAGAT